MFCPLTFPVTSFPLGVWPRPRPLLELNKIRDTAVEGREWGTLNRRNFNTEKIFKNYREKRAEPKVGNYF